MNAAATGIPTAAVYAELQNFYAQQMRLLDEGKAQEWADTFTIDGVLDQDGRPEPLRGRQAIAERVGRRGRLLREQQVRRRHWIGMLSIESHDAGGARRDTRTRYYALVFETVSGGQPRLCLSMEASDELAFLDRRWQVRSRSLHHDAGEPAPIRQR